MPKIIISYRRADTDAIAGRIRDRLERDYGKHSIFMDIDNIPFGTDFREHIQNAILQNDLLLAVVGPNWAGMNETGTARIEEETRSRPHRGRDRDEGAHPGDPAAGQRCPHAASGRPA